MVESGLESGTRLTLRDVPGEWESVTTVWTGAPEPLRVLVARVAAAKAEDRTPGEVAMAFWALAVIAPRAVLHLFSWLFTHPLRLLAAVAVTAVLLATL
ncbi:hypothetical protein [Pilimelia columellifera]|uniref:hypothetical protein n=1 Tax=Pilimelia columellifera TaxID=706574 RepID=UPI0031D9B1A4